jgi:hypothetical protein
VGNAVAVLDPPMGRSNAINTGRVLLGGIVAGVVINLSQFVLNMIVLAADMATSLARMNLPPIGGSAIPVFIALGFAGGVGMLWIYAAIRPRFGPGPRTAVMAGLTVWFFGYAYSGAAMYAMGMYPARMMIISMTWGFIESIVAALVGAAMYSEG